MKPSILTLLCSLSLVACGVDTSATDDPDQGVTQDELRAACSSFKDALTCNHHSHRCLWFQLAIGAPCFQNADGGFTCPPSSGSCVDRKPGGGGSDGGTIASDAGTIGGGGGSDGGVVGACACPNGGVCVNQIGGPAIQSYPPPPTLCVASVSPCASSSVCGCLPTSQGKCSPDPTVHNLCVCDNGIR